MGDHFQTLVDLDASPQDAPRLAERVVAWLVAEGLVQAELLPDCVYGLPLGRMPGPNWHRAVAPQDVRFGPGEGLAVHTERTVFHGGQGTLEAVHCPRCAATTRLHDGRNMVPETWGPFLLAVDTWYETGAADVDCPTCAERVPLPDWTWHDDYFAFAHLGFQLWNWPPLTTEFRTRITGLLDGHRTTYLQGKL
ncbi:hypothetical protein [Streptomyces sp. NPDC098781]|uniref:hypothetical protein n=1 Tax=Streptomyces sp. NPDC098781 TaxID=3366097 RepID=UPI00381660F8